MYTGNGVLQLVSGTHDGLDDHCEAWWAMALVIEEWSLCSTGSLWRLRTGLSIGDISITHWLILTADCRGLPSV